MNKVIEIGRATKDVELRSTTSGASVATFCIAVRRNFKNAEGNNESDFFDCVAFNKLAETISRYVRKGDMVCVVGKLQTRNYTDKNGNNRKAMEIFVDEVEFLTPKKTDNTYPVNDEVKMEEIDLDEDCPF